MLSLKQGYAGPDIFRRKPRGAFTSRLRGSPRGALQAALLPQLEADRKQDGPSVAWIFRGPKNQLRRRKSLFAFADGSGPRAFPLFLPGSFPPWSPFSALPACRAFPGRVAAAAASPGRGTIFAQAPLQDGGRWRLGMGALRRELLPPGGPPWRGKGATPARLSSGEAALRFPASRRPEPRSLARASPRFPSQKAPQRRQPLFLSLPPPLAARGVSPRRAALLLGAKSGAGRVRPASLPPRPAPPGSLQRRAL